MTHMVRNYYLSKKTKNANALKLIYHKCKLHTCVSSLVWCWPYNEQVF